MAGEVMLINPRRRRRKKATTVRRKRRRVRRVRRHNPTLFRKRRTHRRRRHNPVHSRRRRHHVRRNPKLLGIDIKQIALFAGGAVVTEVLADKLAAMLPASWKTDANLVRIGTKAAVGVGLPMVLKMTKLVPSNLANAIAIGGGVVTLLDVFKTYIAPNVPGLHAYEQLSEYRTLPLATGMAGMDEAYGDSAYV
jgi:hypothetical protein